MIRIIEIRYKEPSTGIVVSGQREYTFNDMKQLRKTVAEWYSHLFRLYSYGTTVKVVGDENGVWSDDE